MSPSPLAQRAAAAGVALSYRTDRGEQRAVAPEVVEAVLAALGPPGATDPVAPVVVAWDGNVPPVGVTGEAVTAVLVLEDGTRRPLAHERGALVTDGPMPLGEHHLEVRIDGRDHVVTVLAPPERLVVPARPDGRRHWGVSVPLYALRTGRHDAVGDVTDLALAFDWLHRRGGDVLLTLPLLAGFLDPPAEPSPYAPSSRRFWNELIVDVTRLGDGPPPPPPPPAVGADGLIDYDVVAAHRRSALAAAADAFFERGGDRDPAFRHWLDAHPLAVPYARFRGVAARHGRNWRRWPARLRDGDLRHADGDPGEIRLHLYAQWVADLQLGEVAERARRRGQLLGLDLAVGCHADGFDVWHERDLFVPGMSVGAPPDSFWTQGQDWGFPPVHPAVSRRTGHRYLRESLRHLLRHAGLLRLDHVMGLRRLWWVPAGQPAVHGTYVRYPAEELFAVVCLEAWRAGAIVVGENLGTVPPEIDRAMARHGLLGTFVAQERGAGGLDDPPAASLATLNTHDTATFAGWWQGRDIDDRRALGLLDETAAATQRAQRSAVTSAWKATLGLGEHDGPGETFAAAMGHLLAGPAAVVVAGLEDLWLEERPHNVPGTWRERPNWRRPCAVGLEEIDQRPELTAILDRLASAARRAGADPAG